MAIKQKQNESGSYARDTWLLLLSASGTFPKLLNCKVIEIKNIGINQFAIWRVGSFKKACLFYSFARDLRLATNTWEIVSHGEVFTNNTSRK